jgi:hypothetical protein
MRDDALRDVQWRTLVSLLRATVRSDEEVRVDPSTHQLLLSSGLGALHWWIFANRGQEGGPASLKLEYKDACLRAALLEKTASEVVRALQAEGIEPLLMKGPAVARVYPDRALRPYGDIDLAVAPDSFARAFDIVRNFVPRFGSIDLHAGVRELSDRPWPVLFERRSTIRIADVVVATLGPEDHLRLMALHFLKHGGFRCIWLCDIALWLASHRSGFDWSIFQSGDRWRRRGALMTVRLAHDLLGADVSGTPAATIAVPRWVTESVRNEWLTPGRWPGRPLVSAVLRHPSRYLAEARRRWPSPIESSWNFRAPWNRMPRLPFQLLQIARYQLPALLRSKLAV